LENYLKQKDALHAGRKPRSDSGALTIKELVNRFLNHKQSLVDAGEVSPRTFADYKGTCELLRSQFQAARLVEDLDPDDFAALRKRMVKKGWGPVTIGNTIQRIRSVIKFAADNRLIEKTIVYGQGFARPSKKTLRLNRAKRGPNLFSAEDIRRM